MFYLLVSLPSVSEEQVHPLPKASTPVGHPPRFAALPAPPSGSGAVKTLAVVSLGPTPSLSYLYVSFSLTQMKLL